MEDSSLTTPKNMALVSSGRCIALVFPALRFQFPGVPVAFLLPIFSLLSFLSLHSTTVSNLKMNFTACEKQPLGLEGRASCPAG
jgi:hypothetical protein